MSGHDTESGHNATREYVTVTIAGQLFGMPIEEVHDVFRPQGVASVALSRPEIAGVLNMRGRIVTAIDMRRRLDLPPREPDAPCMAIGIEHGGESYGLVIDEVGEVLRLARDGLEPNPVNLDRRWAYVSAGVHRLEGDLLVVLDVSRLLALVQEEVAA
jgi:purine-binding chemotaxis protein CheW